MNPPSKGARIAAISLALAMALCLLTPVPAGAQAPPPPLARNIHQVVTDVIARHPELSMLGAGSHVQGGCSYKSVLDVDDVAQASDHDFTLLVKDKHGKRAAAYWRQVKNEMRQMIRQRAPAWGVPPDRVEDVLRTVNVYPPDALMAGVENQAEAAARFRELGAAPGLADDAAAMSDAALLHASEGIYGQGADAFRRAEEWKRGRIWQRVGGRVVSGGADMRAMGMRFTPLGTANLSVQFADKAAHELAQGNGRLFMKDIKRLDQFLKKGKQASGATGSMRQNGFLKELLDDYADVQRQAAAAGGGAAAEALAENELCNKLLADPARLARYRAALEQGSYQSRLLAAMHASPNNVKLAEFVTHELSDTRWKRLSRALTNFAAKHQGKFLAVLRGVAAAAYMIQTYQVIGTASQDGWRAGLWQAFKSLNLPAEITESLLKAAEDNGYGFVAGFQDCENLIEGIVQVPGRQSVSEFGVSLERLARDVIEPDTIAKVVLLQARNAADRGLRGKAEGRIESGVADALAKRCTGPILKAWQNERAELVQGFLAAQRRLDTALAGTTALLEHRSTPAGPGKVRVRFSLRPSVGRRLIADLLRKAGETLEDLGGKRREGVYLVRQRYAWTLDGKPMSAPAAPGVDLKGKTEPAIFGAGMSPSFTWSRDQEHTVAVVYDLAVQPISPAPELSGVQQTLHRRYSFATRAVVDAAERELTIKGPDVVRPGAQASFAAQVKGEPGPLAPGLSIFWFDGLHGKELGKGPGLSFSLARPGDYRVTARLYQKRGCGPVFINQAEHAFKVEAEPDPDAGRADDGGCAPRAGQGASWSATADKAAGGWVTRTWRLADLGPSGKPKEKPVTRPAVLTISHSDTGQGFCGMACGKGRRVVIKAGLSPPKGVIYPAYAFFVRVYIKDPAGKILATHGYYIGRTYTGDAHGAHATATLDENNIPAGGGRYTIEAYKDMNFGTDNDKNARWHGQLLMSQAVMVRKGDSAGPPPAATRRAAKPSGSMVANGSTQVTVRYEALKYAGCKPGVCTQKGNLMNQPVATGKDGWAFPLGNFSSESSFARMKGTPVMLMEFDPTSGRITGKKLGGRFVWRRKGTGHSVALKLEGGINASMTTPGADGSFTVSGSYQGKLVNQGSTNGWGTPSRANAGRVEGQVQGSFNFNVRPR